MPRNTVSIIIPTRDRAESLRETLRALGETAVPDDVAVEVLVVDNGSRDRTRPVVRQAKLWGRAPRYVFEPRLGQANARNSGMAAAQGDVLLWIDDDVRPGGAWIEAMCRPILEGRADALAGRIKLPDCLERPWLRPWHRVCLAVDAPQADNFNLIGANMAFARRVLERVPGFDRELGPGGLGFCDDTLFSLQLRTAGFRLAAGGEGSTVEHHCGEHRLARAALRDVLIQQGRSRAYIDYHWQHRTVLLPTFRGGKSLLALSAARFLQRLVGKGDSPHLCEAPGGPFRQMGTVPFSDWVIGRREARWLWRWAYHRQMALEMRRSRHYNRFGLRPLAVPDFVEAYVAGRELRVA